MITNSKLMTLSTLNTV